MDICKTFVLTSGLNICIIISVYRDTCIMNSLRNLRMFVGISIYPGLNAIKTLGTTTRRGGRNKSKHGYCKTVI
jgi:hypothetical protein